MGKSRSSVWRRPTKAQRRRPTKAQATLTIPLRDVTVTFAAGLPGQYKFTGPDVVRLLFFALDHGAPKDLGEEPAASVCSAFTVTVRIPKTAMAC